MKHQLRDGQRRFTLVWSQEMYDQVEAAAKAEDRPLGWIVRKAVETWLKERSA